MSGESGVRRVADVDRDTIITAITITITTTPTFISRVTLPHTAHCFTTVIQTFCTNQPDPLSAYWMFAQEANKHLSIGHLNVVFVLVPCLVSALSIIIVILILNLTIHKYVNRPSLFSIMTTTQIKNISNISNRIF